MNNRLKVNFPAIPENESVARTIVSAFLVPLDPTIRELDDVRTAVSEAVSNAIIHAYPKKDGDVILEAVMQDNKLRLTIEDNGIGIQNVEKAREPMFTTCPELERSGMGFTFMEAFMNEVEVESSLGNGCKVTMLKIFGEACEREE